MNSYQRELTDFLSGYGATKIEIVAGGKHPKIEFDFRGKHISYTIATSPSDHRASANSIGDLKRMLGEPIEEEVARPRRLSDMLPAAVERPTFPGKLALYRTGKSRSLMLRFFVPKTLIDATGISLGQQFSISALDQYTWHFHLIAGEGGKHPSLTKEKTNELFYVVRASPKDLTKLRPFGVSPAEYSVVGDAFIVHLPAETIKAATQPAASAPASDEEEAHHRERLLVARAQMQPIPAPAGTDDAPIVERLRALLAMIRGAERQTGYRLVKVRREEQHDGVWTWRAPEIRLDD